MANYIVHSHALAQEEITQKRLYKLLYFAHGWHLAERRAPLVWNYFEAWEHGPVIKVVRDSFKDFGNNSITKYARHFEFESGSWVELPHQLVSFDEKFVDAVVESYRKYSADQLSLITHAGGSPWDRIWRSEAPIGRFGLRITNDEILTDFQDVVIDRPPPTTLG